MNKIIIKFNIFYKKNYNINNKIIIKFNKKIYNINNIIFEKQINIKTKLLKN